MTAISLPADLQTWAEAEVSAGRAQSVEQIVVTAMRGYKSALEAFRKSLDDAVAEADEKGWLEADEVFDYVEERLAAREAFEAEWSQRRKSA